MRSLDGAPPLDMPTERDEVASNNSMKSSFTTRTRMLAVDELSASTERPPPLCASSRAVDHPALAIAGRHARALGYRIAVDTSLRDRPDARELPRNAQMLLAHLHTVGAYFSPVRKCIGLAEDCTWHEVVHEICHLKFDARDINPELRHLRRQQQQGSKHSSAAAAPASTASDDEPIRTHFLQYRARGYGPLAAEELVAREHELRALTCSGAPIWRWLPPALFVLDSALIEAQRDLASTPAPQRTPAQAAEWWRVGWIRSCITGPGPRLAYVFIPLLGASMLMGSLCRRVRAHSALPRSASSA